VLILTSLGFTMPAQPQGGAPFRPDWGRLAELVVARSLQLGPGERVLVSYDPARDPGLITAIRDAVGRTGGVILAELPWPDGEWGRSLDTLPPDRLAARAAAEDSAYRPLFAAADVYLWLHATRHRDVPRRWEKLIAGSSVRAIHFHWFLPPDSAEAEQASRMYQRAIAVDPAALDAVEGRLEGQLRGARVRLTAPNGTDLSFRVPQEAGFHRNTGDASRSKMATARSTRDREEELPAGVLRTTDLRDLEGTLVGTTIAGHRGGTVRVTFRGGRVTALQGEGPAGEWLARGFAAATGDRDLPSELVIGVNPELQPILPSGFMPYYGYGAGIVRIAIGDNWESGGRNRASDHWEAWLFVTDGTLRANGATVIRHGQLVPE
jgi:leucyl aminopeptidase (aminopeptidase T)